MARSVSSKTSTGPTVNSLLLTNAPPRASAEDHQDRPEPEERICMPPRPHPAPYPNDEVWTSSDPGISLYMRGMSSGPFEIGERNGLPGMSIPSMTHPYQGEYDINLAIPDWHMARSCGRPSGVGNFPVRAPRNLPIMPGPSPLRPPSLNPLWSSAFKPGHVFYVHLNKIDNVYPKVRISCPFLSPLPIPLYTKPISMNPSGSNTFRPSTMTGCF